MPSGAVSSFADPDEFAAAIPANVELSVTSCGSFAGKLTRVRLHRLHVQRAYNNLPGLRHSANNPGWAVIAFRASSGPALVRNGREIYPSEIVRCAEQDESYIRSSGPILMASMWLPVDEMVSTGATMAACDLGQPRHGIHVRPTSAAMTRLRRLHAAAGQLAEDAPDIVANTNAARGLEQTLIEAMVACLAPHESTMDSAARGQHALIMRRFHRVLAEHADQPFYIPELCKAIRISERTLRTCCQEYLGMGPNRYLLVRRMDMARRALRNSSANSTTVAEIATQYGFWQLGRFAVEYRARFGESPSATLRQ